MPNSTEVYCLNAYDSLGNFLCTLRCWQPSEIWQDYQYLIPNIWNREVEYICYTDKCGCVCCLSNENEIIIHSTQWEIKTLTTSVSKNCIWTKFSEIFWWNWCKTMVRYKTGWYPTSISDWSLWFEELTQNQYCSTTKWITWLSYETTYYLRAFALDWNNNIITSKCISATTGSNFVTTCRWYTWAMQSIQLWAWTYKLEVWGASWWRWADGSSWDTCWWLWGCWWYSSGCITLNSSTTLYIYVWWEWCSILNGGCAGGYNWWWNWHCGSWSRWWGWGWATHIATASWLLCTLSWNQSAVKIVAWWGGWTTRNCKYSWWHWWWLCWTQWWACSWTWWGYWTQTWWWGWWNSWWFWYWWNSWTWSCNPWWGWGWGWYWWWGWYSYGSGCMSNWWWGSWYIWWVSWWITCRWNQSFPTAAWWTETWHYGCGCVKISPV